MAQAAWFDRWAADYDADRRLLIECFDDFYGAAGEVAALHLEGTARKRGADGGPVRVLDIGAGTGLLAAALIEALPADTTVTLLDEAPGMLAHAQERLAPLGDRVSIVVGDAGADLPDGPFDVIASGLALHHLAPADQPGVYRAAAARLAPGGVFVNADQVRGRTEGLEDYHRERIFTVGHQHGLTHHAEHECRQRIAIDQHVPLAEQLDWMRAAGLQAPDCIYRSWRFAVMAGWAPAAA